MGNPDSAISELADQPVLANAAGGSRGAATSRWIFCAILFALLFAGFGAHNNFPFYYHPDEPGKVKQISENKRNFHHPLLMLTTTHYLMKVMPGKLATFQKIAVFGRYTSVLFMSLAGVALVWIGWSLAGPVAGCCVGLLFLISPPLFEFAHYMKEDPSLVFGLAVSFLSFQLYWQKQTLGRLIWVGIACSLAASGKYVGFIVVPFALIIVAAAPALNSRTRFQRLGIFLGCFLAGCALINYPMLKNSSLFAQSLTRETDVALAGHKGLVSKDSQSYYLNAIRTNTPAGLLVLAAIGVGSLFVRRKSTQLPEWIALACMTCLALMISFSPKVSLRYALPLLAIIPFYAGLGIAGLAAIPSRGLRWAGITVALALGLWGIQAELPVLLGKYRSMGMDDRAQLREFVRTELPAAAVIAQDDRVNFPTADHWEYTGEPLLPQKIEREEFAADLGSLQELRARGVTHVAICRSTYERFLSGFKPSDKVKADFDRRKAFYDQVRQECKLVWGSKPGAVIYTQPGLSLYDITKTAEQSPAQP